MTEDPNMTIEAYKVLVRISAGENVRLTASEAERLRRHILWLSDERDSLIGSRSTRPTTCPVLNK